MRTAIHCFLALLVVVVPAAPSQDFAGAEQAYLDAVRDRLSSESLSTADIEPARAAVDALAATGNAKALEIFTADANKLGERLFDLKKEHAGTIHDVEGRKEKLEGQTGSERKENEEQIKKDEARVTEIRGLVEPLEKIRDAIYEGLLEVTSKTADVDPEAAWGVLVAYFESDTELYYQLDQRVRQVEARLAATRQKILEENDAEKKSRLEKDEIELAAALEVESVKCDQIGALKDRRVATLADLFARLPKGRRSKEENAIKANLRPDVKWETRAVHVELLGRLPLDSALDDVLAVMKRAAKEHDDIEKELGPLREAYYKALTALNTSLVGGNGVVPTAVLTNKNQRESELRAVSKRGFGEARVLDSCVVALGAAVARLPADALDAAVDQVMNAVNKGRDVELRSRAVAGLGRVDSEKVRETLRKIARDEPDLSLRLAALDALAELGDDATVELCVTELLRSPEWRIRAAAIRTLVKIPRKNAIPALIQSVAVEVGRLVDDAEQALFALTGMAFNGDAALWKDWWQKNKDTFEIGGVGEAVAAASSEWKNAPGHVSFYGITTRSNRILFVIDRSGSMAEPVGDANTGPGAETKMAAAKQQLKAAVAGLQDGDLFNIVSYAVDVGRWEKKMQKSSTKVQKRVEKYIDKDVQAGGGTNIHDALMEAFRLAGIGAMDKAYDSNVDTIFFLTDGQPTVGEVQDPTEILRRVQEWNRLARVVVHAVGIGKDHDAAFLRRLASENGGQYTSR